MTIGQHTIAGGQHPELRVMVDGQPVVMVPDQQKRAILDAGYVYLGPDFEDRLPMVQFTVDGQTTELRGFTDNPELVDLFRGFLLYCNP
jgi:hypothetical protein